MEEYSGRDIRWARGDGGVLVRGGMSNDNGMLGMEYLDGMPSNEDRKWNTAVMRKEYGVWRR